LSSAVISTTAVLLAGTIAGCSSSSPSAGSPDPLGTGGSAVSGTGGKLGTGGTLGTGGKIGTGGTVGTGGALSIGGKGGATGTGGFTGQTGGGPTDAGAESGNLPDAGKTDTGVADAGSGDAPGDRRPVADAGGADLPAGCQGNETFKAAQQAMLSSCSGGPGILGRSCHMGGPDGSVLATLGAGLNLDSTVAYGNLVGVHAVGAPSKLRVQPSAPSESFLVQKLTNQLLASEGLPMPKGEAIQWQPPDPAKLRVLTCWIARGAPND
jgi:hypothetical protein